MQLVKRRGATVIADDSYRFMRLRPDTTPGDIEAVATAKTILGVA